MRFRRNEALANGLIVIGLIFLAVGLLLPHYKSPQTLDGEGPGKEFTPNSPYWIRNYVVPPIDAGTPISLNVLADKPGSSVVILAPFDSETQSIELPLVNAVFGPDQKGLVVFTEATKTSAYMLSITSYNSSYRFQLTSVWSPFFQFRTLTTYALALLPAGLVLLYYENLQKTRELSHSRASLVGAAWRL